MASSTNYRECDINLGHSLSNYILVLAGTGPVLEVMSLIVVVDTGDTGYSLDHTFNVHWRLFLRVLSSGKNFNCLIFFKYRTRAP